MLIELNMLMHVTASAYKLDSDYIDKLRAVAIQKVKKSNGNISLKNTLKNYDENRMDD